MKKCKNVFKVLLMCILVVLLVGCSSNSGESNDKKTKEKDLFEASNNMKNYTIDGNMTIEVMSIKVPMNLTFEVDNDEALGKVSTEMLGQKTEFLIYKDKLNSYTNNNGEGWVKAETEAAPIENMESFLGEMKTDNEVSLNGDEKYIVEKDANDLSFITKLLGEDYGDADFSGGKVSYVFDKNKCLNEISIKNLSVLEKGQEMGSLDVSFKIDKVDSTVVKKPSDLVA